MPEFTSQHFELDENKCQNKAADSKVVQSVNATSIGGKYSGAELDAGRQANDLSNGLATLSDEMTIIGWMERVRIDSSPWTSQPQHQITA